MQTLFHLSIPMHDFSLAKAFYLDLLECHLGRETEHAVIFQFGQHQLIGHKVEDLPPLQEGIYPRHFGLIFLSIEEFEQFKERLVNKKVPFQIPLKTRFPQSRVEHQSFFLKDPSNNLLEFKHYKYDSAIFAEHAYPKVGES